MRGRRLSRILIVSLLAAGMWLYVFGVLVPYQKSQPARLAEPGGNYSDLCPYYLGTRELLLHQRSPYTPEFSAQNQLCYSGRVVNPNNPDFTYPPYVAFVLSPTLVFSEFRTARLAVAVFLLLLTAASVPMWMRACRLEMKAGTVALLALGLLAAFPVVQGLVLQQLTMLEAGLLAACAAALVAGRLGLAGVLLGLATFKPNLAGPVVVWLMVWGLAEWRQRRGFVISFGATLALLLTGSELILPGWFGRWWGVLHSYVESEQSQPLILLLTGREFGTVLRYALIAAVAGIAWSRRKDAAGTPRFSVTFALVLATNVLTIPVWHTYDQVLLLPALLLILSEWRKGVSSAARPSLFALTAVGLSGPVSALGLVLISAVSRADAFRWYWVPLAATIPFPLTVFIALGATSAGILFREQRIRKQSSQPIAAS